MISTKDYRLLPNRKILQAICKALSVLDEILYYDWEYRYFSYNNKNYRCFTYKNKWIDNEEICEMQKFSGDRMQILFLQDGCVINGFAQGFEQQEKQRLISNLPSIFDEFIFGELVKNIGTTFCLWTNDKNEWQVGDIENYEDNSEEMLSIFDGNPQTYLNWAIKYFEESCIEKKIILDTVTKIYERQALTKEMVLTIVEEFKDWKQLEITLNKISYPYNFD